MPEEKADWEKVFDTKDDKGISLEVSYSSLRHAFKVAVSYAAENMSEIFQASYEPKFGMDVEDQARAMEIAERLAAQLEQKLNL